MVMEECIVGANFALIFTDLRNNCSLWSVKATVGMAYIMKEALRAAM